MSRLDIQERASRVKLLLMDVDGVLTDSRVYFIPTPDGSWTETKGFDSQDGIALHWLHWHGIKTGVISGRKSRSTTFGPSPANCSRSTTPSAG